MVHSRYAQRGGEDEVYESERDLLRSHGHSVVEYIQENNQIKGSKPWMVGVRTIWSQQDYRAIRAVIRQHSIQVVSVHNFFPLISPGVFYAARAERVPSIQTLHNFRLICPSAFLLRDEAICEDCVGKAVPFPGILHACYRKSRLLSAGVAGMLSSHRLAGTWTRMVDRYVALTPFMRQKFIEGGFPADKITVKPNFRQDPGLGSGDGGYFLFVGRLSREKGVSVLLQAWRLADCGQALHIVGSGPEELSLRAQAAKLPGVSFLGQLPQSEVLEQMRRATALIFPSVWYEGFPLVCVESLGTGTPIVASNLGALQDIVRDGGTGHLFAPGDAEALAQILRSWKAEPALRASARARYEAEYTPERGYEELMKLYHSVLPEVFG